MGVVRWRDERCSLVGGAMAIFSREEKKWT
jgi:hypothetical protein